MRNGEVAVAEFIALRGRCRVLQDVFLEAAEFRRSIRGACIRGVGARSWVGIDHTKTTGEKFGKEWLATLTNELGQLISVLAVNNTKASELLAWCTSIKKRASFVAGGTGSVLVVDNVPTNFVQEDAADRHKSLACEALGLEATFHVMSNTTKFANNDSSQCFKDLILGLRNAVRIPVQKHYDDVKRASLSGQIQFAKPRSWQKDQWSVPEKGLSEIEIARWESTGALHHFFTQDLCIVPYEHLDWAGMDAEFDELKAKLTLACFDVDLNGEFIPKVEDGGKGILFPSHKLMLKIIDNCCTRAKFTIPPAGSSSCRAAFEGGEASVKHDLPVFRPEHHTGQRVVARHAGQDDVEQRGHRQARHGAGDRGHHGAKPRRGQGTGPACAATRSPVDAKAGQHGLRGRAGVVWARFRCLAALESPGMCGRGNRGGL